MRTFSPTACLRLAVVLVMTSVALLAQDMALRDVHKVFLEKMPNDLDQYLSAEITKQLRDRLVVVLDKSAADAILTGTSTANTSAGAAVANAWTGHDSATGAIRLVDRDEKVVLWSAQEGDRSKWIGTMKRGPSKVAERLIGDLKDALQKAK